MKFGLLPTPPDERDFKLGQITVLPKLSELPFAFRLTGTKIRHQKGSDFCTAFMACGMSEMQEDTDLSPEWSFAKSKELSGDIYAFGQDIRTALKVHTKWGAIDRKDAPYSIDKKDPDFLRDIRNWPELTKKATKHIKKSYLKVTGPYDNFDNIRATIWKYRSERRAVGTGVYFAWKKEDKYFTSIPPNGEGHAMYICGWIDNDHLIFVNSWGTDAGDKGYHYVHRSVINTFVEIFGAYMFLDMDPETVKYMQENGITDKDNYIVELYKVVVTLLKELLAVKKTQK